MRFQGKKVLITGAGHGIGLAIARAFKDEGARLAINDIDSVRIKQALRMLGNTSFGFPADVTDSKEARKVVSKAELELGGLDIVVSKKGVIITISSGSARFARIGSAHYCASKAAVVMLTRVMALELAPYKIRVNSVSPGIIDIPGGQPLTEDYKRAMTRMVPWGRMGRPEDVAKIVLLVSDPAAEYMTGQVIPVDGGQRTLCGWFYFRRGW